MQALPHARLLPLVEAAVAGRAGTEAELERQMPPGDPGVQHEQDPLQRLPVRQSLATREAEASLHLRQQRLQQLPQRVRDDPRRDGHRHPPSLTTGADGFAAAAAVPSYLQTRKLSIFVADASAPLRRKRN